MKRNVTGDFKTLKISTLKYGAVYSSYLSFKCIVPQFPLKKKEIQI